ncbi:hypothetical protein [Ascidiaceihabitans sp.]|uniref:hypothetical protein n=1 Tax=Ascidiaceihabitans sp. TaxID=1872644 RepID=UPI003296CA18
MSKDERDEFSQRSVRSIETSRADVPDNFEGQTFSGEVKATKVIAGAIRGIFDAKVIDIENFYHLICQRVKDQSECRKVTTELVLYLNDGTSRRLQSIDDFQKYSQPNAAFPTVVSLSIELEIIFAGSSSSEKQSVDIAIRASDITADTIQMQATEDRIRFASDKMQIAVMAAQSDLGIISYTIDHTRLSWGLDIENIIQSHVSKLLIPATWQDKCFKAIREPLHLMTTIIVGLFLAVQGIDALFKILFISEGRSNDVALIDIASDWIVSGQIAKYLVISIIVSVVVILLTSTLSRQVLSNLQKPRPSFILLSTNDETRREQRLSKHNKRWARLLAVVFVNLVAILVTVAVEDRVGELYRSLFG